MLHGQITSAAHNLRDFWVPIAKALQNCGIWGQANAPNQATDFTSMVIFPCIFMSPAPMGVMSWDTWRPLPWTQGACFVQEECNGIAKRMEKGKSFPDLFYVLSQL